MDSGTITQKGRYFSLKWKSVLLFSLILIAVNISLTVFSYGQLTTQHREHREQILNRQWLELKGLLENGYAQMEQFAALIPMFESRPSSSAEYSNHLRSIFDRHATILELDLGIGTAQFHSATGQEIFSWRATSGTRFRQPWIQRAIEQESPVRAIDCTGTCMQYIAYPLLSNGRLAGILFLGKSIADAVIDFTRITGADLAVLSGRQNSVPGQVREDRYLDSWNLEVSAITASGRNIPILRKMEREYDRGSIVGNSILLQHGGKSYEVYSHTFSIGEDNHAPQMLIINDVTEILKGIEDATATSLTMGAAGLVLSESILLLLLWAPLNRLKEIALALPLLARHSFDEARKRIKRDHHKLFGRDEIDIVGETALALSRELESLENEVMETALSLKRQRDHISRDRDFIVGLLETAQVIILTLDNNGNILTINRYGLEITQFDQESLIGRNFHTLLVNTSNKKFVYDEFSQLSSGKIDHYRHECNIQTELGNELTISWSHSRLADHPGQQASILSVGLDITQREDAKRKLAWLANHDSLTELYNRRHFQNKFRYILEMSRRYNRDGALLFIDLDHFKLINDTSGHQAGDTLLRMIAEKMQKLVRVTDLLARLGGDEFALVLPETNQQEAIKVAQKIMANVGSIEIPVNIHVHHVSTSIGIVMFPLHGSTMHDLMANADLAMYQAKDRGRNCWHLFSLDEGMRERMDSRIKWKRKIELALEEDRFTLHFQPIMDIRNGHISHHEVLLRMVDQDGSLIYPGNFIPEAEQTGIILNIDRMVLRKAIMELEKLKSSGHTPVFAINLSGGVIDDPELPAVLKDLLEISGIDSEQLIFEVTETTAVSDISSAQKLMKEIRKLGCKFALDDFGSGFSSFYYLKQLPVDFVKIDGSFIRQLSGNPDDQLFVNALAQVARGLGKLTIAEFVGDERTLQMLREYGVDYAQGYYIGKPAEELRFDK
jgi:diguanylate cyclase (GGDEF)-like protein/PAS domain S-box-containing protein